MLFKTEKTRTIDARAEGVAEGIAAGGRAMIPEMLNKGLSDDMIFKLSKMIPDELVKLKAPF